MEATKYITVSYERTKLPYRDACELAGRIQHLGHIDKLTIDLSKVTRATIPGFARLIVLRRALRESGYDLQIIGLQGHPHSLYTVSRLPRLLPRERAECTHLPRRQRG